jgi:hypothetical protein
MLVFTVPTTSYGQQVTSKRLQLYTKLLYLHNTRGGSGSSVGIATGYGLDGSGIESRWG